jgi:hypothetical protein
MYSHIASANDLRANSHNMAERAIISPYLLPHYYFTKGNT